MAITSNSNLNALRAIRQLDRASSTLSSIYERLASGSRINSASDDAAGLSIATSLETKRRVYSRGIANVNDALSLINITTAATSTLTSILTRLNELAVQASNGTYTNTQRSALDQEAQALIQEHDRIIKTTSFNGIRIFSEANKRLNIQAGDSPVAVKLGAEKLVGDFSFGSSTIYTESTSMIGYTVSGDFNGDGNVDLAGINISEDGYANIMLGNGNGTFTAAISYYVGSNSGTTGSGYQGAITTSDINGDGEIDIVFGKTGGFTTLIGNGDGTFYAGASATVGAGFGTQGVAAGDFNNDGYTDIIIASISGGYTPLFLGNADGTFKAALTNVMPVSMSPVVIGDMNGDGNLDVVGVSGFSTGIHLGQGDGTFVSYAPISMGAAAPLIGDFNGDGRPDIALTPGNAGFTRIFLANGDGTYAAGVTLTDVTVATPQAKLTDIDQDGILDIVVADVNARSLLVHRGNGDGTFEAFRQTILPTFALGRGLIIEDLDHDGVLDMVSAGASGSSWYSVVLGHGAMAERAAESRLLNSQGINLKNRQSALSALSTIKCTALDLI